MNALSGQNGIAVTARPPINCPAGQHAVDLSYRWHHWPICSPDVPGNGLPWDTPNLVCFVGLMVLGFAALVWICWFITQELRRESRLPK